MARSNFSSCYCYDFENLINFLNSFINCLDQVQSENKNTVSHYFYENVGFQNIMVFCDYVRFSTAKMRFS